jgi:alanyl-tRNA synthetase
VLSSDVRRAFIDYFGERGHLEVPSIPLVPAGDPSLLFTSAGMVPFKSYFMGLSEPPARRLASIQKVFRATDLDEVGDTSHLTFFEMMGNFSIGDYFKEEAIDWCWDFLTRVLGIPGDKLWVTIYLDDEVAHDAWIKQGVTEERILRYDQETNFWFSGDTGPCGPDSEVFYDFGPQPDCPDCEPAHDGHVRFLEIWNNVFTMYFRNADGSFSDLPRQNIDTGSGLERVSAVLQGTYNVYASDLFRPLIERIEDLSGRSYGNDKKGDRAFRVVAEHARALTFLVGDGVSPSNEGRGYVLRRLLRRAVYFGRGLGLDGPFVSEVAGTVVERMKEFHPNLGHQRAAILRLMKDEEDRFSQTLRRGIEILEGEIDKSGSSKVIAGDSAFRLYDTFGLPIELTSEIAAERGLSVDLEAYQQELEQQRERARAGQKFKPSEFLSVDLSSVVTEFVGYDALEADTSVVATLEADDLVPALSEGHSGALALAASPFYPEGGGQVGDAGMIVEAGAQFVVEDTQRRGENLLLHFGRVVSGEIRVGNKVVARVDGERREATMRNHTATHLVHAALREVLGPHVRQTGSLVAPDRLRFDFSHGKPLTREELRQVERLVNAKIRQDVSVRTRLTGYQEAIAEGVIAFFGDKYGAEVRVVEVPNGVAFSSAELCGGTHCHRTGQVGFFVVVSEGSVGAGVRRIEALTGLSAEEWLGAQRDRIEELGSTLGAQPAELVLRARALSSELEALRRRVASAERERGRESLQVLIDRAASANGSRVLAERVDATSVEALRELADGIREKIGSGIVVLAAIFDGKPAFLAMVTPDLASRGIHAGKLVKQVAAVTGGGGGGRPEMAQAGGKDASKLEEALALARDVARRSLETGK